MKSARLILRNLSVVMAMTAGVVFADFRDFDELAGAAGDRVWRLEATEDAGKVKLENDGADSATGLTCRWTALRDGVPFAAGAWNVSEIKPHAARVFDLPPYLQSLRADHEGVFALRVKLLRGETTVAADQLDLPGPTPRYAPGAGEVTVATNGDALAFHTDRADFLINRRDAMLRSVVRHGPFGDRELLASPLHPDIGGAAIAGSIAKVSAVTTSADGAKSFSATVDWRTVGAASPQPVLRTAVRWTVYGDGTLAFEAQMRSLEDPTAELPRIGFDYALTDEDRTIEWFGRGPHADLGGKVGGQFVGRWRQEPAEFLRSGAVRTDVYGYQCGGLTVRTLGARLTIQQLANRRMGFYAAICARASEDWPLAVTFRTADDDLGPRRLAVSGGPELAPRTGHYLHFAATDDAMTATVELPERRAVKGIRLLRLRNAAGVKVATSGDGRHWHEQAVIENAAGELPTELNFPVAVSAKSIRLTAIQPTGTGDFAPAAEIETIE